MRIEINNGNPSECANSIEEMKKHVLYNDSTQGYKVLKEDNDRLINICIEDGAIFCYSDPRIEFPIYKFKGSITLSND